MFSTADCMGNVSKRDQEIFVLILRLMQFLRIVHDKISLRGKRHLVKNIWPNCHSSCRALRVHLGDCVEVVDGCVIGASQYIVSDGDDNSVFRKVDDSIQHSWLKLPDDSLVDPFPAGAYALSPILFPPFGRYQDVFPGSVYMAADKCPPYANTEATWKRAENIARILSFFPSTPEEVSQEKSNQLLKKMSGASVGAADYLMSAENSLHVL